MPPPVSVANSFAAVEDTFDRERSEVMQDNPFISIALPVKNGMPHLPGAVEALRRQSYPNFELVIQDGGSTDGSLEYLHGLDVPFSVHIVSEDDGSLTAGYNRALKRCRGELAATAGCDEVLEPNALELFASWYRKHPRAIYIYGGCRVIAGSGAVQDYEPKDFGFIDFIRHQMCPPLAAGAFNRSLLGPELYMDESLRTAPDFELLARLALRFGEDRILRMRGTLLTALCNESSMTYRADAYEQIARDKGTVLNRLLHGDMREAFLDYFQRDLLFNMHAQFAEQTFHMPDGEPVFQRHLLAAAAAMPGMSRLKYLASLDRRFRWDEYTRSLTRRENVAPLPPPKQASLVSKLDLCSIRSEPDWQASGAELGKDRDGVQLRTGNGPWHYSALVRLNLAQPVRPNTWRWLRIAFSNVQGTPMAALFDPTSNDLQDEVPLVARPGISEVFLELHDPAYTHLLFRNGASSNASTVLIRAIEFLSMSIVPELAA